MIKNPQKEKKSDTIIKEKITKQELLEYLPKSQTKNVQTKGGNIVAEVADETASKKIRDLRKMLMKDLSISEYSSIQLTMNEVSGCDQKNLENCDAFKNLVAMIKQKNKYIDYQE